MAAGIVSASMGAMNPLLGKLTVLMRDEYRKLAGVRKQASFLRDELSAMKALLEKLELVDELDPLARNWRDHVREMSYDMENCIDHFVRNLGAVDASTGFIRRTTQFLKKLWMGEQISDQIEELKALAVEANDRRKRYKIDDCISSSRVVSVDPRVSAIYKEAESLVGIDGPKKDLVDWLTDSEKKLKVVSIVGFGGLGKTTLAKQVYNEIGGQFSCKAFVSVSQRPDMTSLLGGLLLQLGLQESSRIHKVQDIIDRIRDHITHKRYLIVIDDLWDQSAWNIINCAFAEDCNGSRITVTNGSRVIVTTRVDDVALWACRYDSECIYRMKPLKEQDSRSLFFNRIFGFEASCPSHLEEIAAQILKKCSGLPLAVVTIASLISSLQTRSREDWESIRNSLGSKFSAKPTLEEMRSILNLSYMHLPLHLRACFLYLGMYPEDHVIDRDDLVQQWIAEGFVKYLHGSDLEAAAKSYYNELINRSMIQPVKTSNGEVLSCKVHDMMLDLILSKCAEDNFLSVAYNYKEMERLRVCEYKVRRLSLQSSTGCATSGSITTGLPQVRSFAQFGKFSYAPPLSLFKYLRVLAFDFSSNWDIIIDLTAISQLFQLRYLKVSASTGSIELPTEIKELDYLETLHIDGQFAHGIPSDIGLLPRLSRLFLPYGIGLPEGIGNIKSLCSLSCFGMEKSSIEDIKGLGGLTNLRDLCLVWPYGCNMEALDLHALASSIGKLCNLKHLTLNGAEDGDDPLSSLCDPPGHIEKLDMSLWSFKRIPKWIGDLHCLCTLRLDVELLSTDEVNVLGKLPSLSYLGLTVSCTIEDMAAIICTASFPVLESLLLNFDDDIAGCVSFEAGAMPKLQSLDLVLSNNWSGTTPVGMEYLLSLEHILVLNVSDFHGHRDVESAFKKISQMLPRLPSIKITELLI